MASTYSTRPSELLGITDDAQAFYLDRACWLFGSQLDAQVEAATKNAKNDVARQTVAKQVMEKALSSGTIEGSAKKQGGYRDPALMKR